MTDLCDASSKWMRWVWPVLLVCGPLFQFVHAAAAPDFPANLVDRWRWWLVFLALFLVYVAFIRPLADAVYDAGDHLVVVRGSTSVQVPLRSIVRLSEGGNFGSNFSRRQSIVLHLASPTALGQSITFVPRAGPYARVGMFHHLRLRVERATHPSVRPNP